MTSSLPDTTTTERPGAAASAQLALHKDQPARLELSGRWRMDLDLPAPEPTIARLRAAVDLHQLDLSANNLADWDSSLAVFILSVQQACKIDGIACDLSALPEALRALLKLAGSAPEQDKVAEAEPAQPGFLGRLGLDFIDLANATGEIMHFFGEGTLAVQRFVRGKSRFRLSEFWLIIESAGADALPIVSLVCFLVGMILAYIGNQQLAQFGARIYIADLVGLAMVIQIGALVTAIVLAGRTGAAFAAQIGAMQANEEIDALRTLGVSPMEFLVLPRMLALILMTPLLTLYANLFGILGGLFVGTMVAGLTSGEYLMATRNAIAVNHLAQGLISATVYGAIVAASGCLRGMQCGRSAAEVGRATTSAVVTAILFIVIAAAVLTVLFEAIGLS
ncbi:ABC transporter permease [Thiorhodovibrio frisius]|uniref:ABC-type transport system involved in resistance to organic solvents, permease component n=1 Tax=Thiorhodovibrio frisius TaxID=631362 RepID=H8Z4Z0_9GAMM|nr:ABC transporter permease [Thiorhodovibrio frisius]EIC20397.1 ABC-type transport system involved in resistance to organic solvents, permease component [Thiorhodovibrio frisius]WPL21138.1 putative phospholipid ABC transporter permease protein MlaE [Thiorhodovibrio frisius]